MQHRDSITFPAGWLLGSFGFFSVQLSPLNLGQFSGLFKQGPVPKKKRHPHKLFVTELEVREVCE